MDELAKRFAELADKYGPKVADAALSAARIEAFSQLMAGVLCLIVGATLIYTAKCLWRKWTQEKWDDITMMPFGICVLVGSIVAVIGVWAFVNPWTWVAINHPELWIAKKAFRI